MAGTHQEEWDGNDNFLSSPLLCFGLLASTARHSQAMPAPAPSKLSLTRISVPQREVDLCSANVAFNGSQVL